MEILYLIDIWLFHAVNNGWSNPLLDLVMPVVTNTAVWRPIYAVAAILLIWKGGVRGRWAAGTLIVAVAVLDPLSTHLLKEPIGRLRPYDVLGGVHQLIGSGSGSFPSNHALNNAAAAVILTFFYRDLSWVWWSLAIVIGLSRIYCGVHWPSDIIAGFLLGAGAGWMFTRLVRLLWKTTAIPQP